MNLTFFQNGIENEVITNPNTYFREQQQAFIDQEWEYTTAKYVVKEQDDFGSDVYNDIEVWMDYVVGLVSRGTTNGDDFRQLIFRSINHPLKRGLYYQFDNNYWLTYFTDEISSLSKDIGVRRCNNLMRIVDPEDGSIFSIPCVIEYDMASPNVQVSRYIITPNNHATVMVQGNEDTLRLFKLNTRYIFGGRPFKLLAYQNTLVDKSISDYPTLLYLDLYLDEIQPKDDIENQLADNGQYTYSLEIDSDDMELTKNSNGTLGAIVLLNGEEVTRQIVWSSSNTNVVTIDENGNYQVTENPVGSSCIITASLFGNETISDTIKITIVEQELVQAKLITTPVFNSVRQFENLEFSIEVNYGSNKIVPNTVEVSLAQDSVVLNNKYLSIVQNQQNNFTIIGNEISLTPQNVYINITNDDPQLEENYILPVVVTSMMG